MALESAINKKTLIDSILFGYGTALNGPLPPPFNATKINGAGGENPEDILETIKLVLQIPPPFYLSVNNLIYFEGTPLYRRALADGIIKQESDTAEMLNYWDRWQHIKLKKKNPYLNLLLNMMRGPATKSRFGLMPRSLVKKLISPKLVSFNLKNEIPTKTIGSMVSFMDWGRENVAKPVYRSLPIEFKSWYDQVRYKA